MKGKTENVHILDRILRPPPGILEQSSGKASSLGKSPFPLEEVCFYQWKTSWKETEGSKPLSTVLSRAILFPVHLGKRASKGLTLLRMALVAFAEARKV